MSLDIASPQLNRVTFVGNSASRGGGIQSYLGTRPFQELTFRRNHASRGPNIFVMRRP
jgi:predicted outer membrane repeat protein